MGGGGGTCMPRMEQELHCDWSWFQARLMHKSKRTQQHAFLSIENFTDTYNMYRKFLKITRMPSLVSPSYLVMMIFHNSHAKLDKNVTRQSEMANTSPATCQCLATFTPLKSKMLIFFSWRHFSARSSCYIINWYGYPRGFHEKYLKEIVSPVFEIRYWIVTC